MWTPAMQLLGSATLGKLFDLFAPGHPFTQWEKQLVLPSGVVVRIQQNNPCEAVSLASDL